MSRTIDERIVDMQFRNDQFQEGISDSLKSLENLKKGLDNLDGTGKALDGVGEAVGGLKIQFDMLQIMAITAIAKMTDAIIDFGLNAARTLLLDPITQGFSKYENEVEAVQRIMNATGHEIEYVSEQLDRLLWFTDETSFRFMDMVTSIGKFTGMGIELEDAVVAMQGISTWAAQAGAGTSGASTAMEALSVSMGMGVVRLREWRRLENINMTTQEFRQVVLANAVALGTLEKGLDGVYHGLGKTGKEFQVTAATMQLELKEDWFTSDVLMAALEQYGAYAAIVANVSETMGITAIEAMRYIDAYAADGFAGLEKAVKSAYGAIADDTALRSMIDTAHSAMIQIDSLSETTIDLGRRSFRAAQETKTWGDLVSWLSDSLSTTWMVTWRHLIGNFEEARDMWSGLAEILHELIIYPRQITNAMLGMWKSMGGRDILLEGIVNVGKTLLTIIESISEAFREIFPRTTANQLLAITENFRNFTQRLIMGEETADNLRRTFAGIFAVFNIGISIITGTARALAILISAIIPFGAAGGGILKFTAAIGDMIVAFQNFLLYSETFNNIMYEIGFAIGTVIYVIHKVVGAVIPVIMNAVLAIGDVIFTSVYTIIPMVVSTFSSLINMFRNFFTIVINVVTQFAPIVFDVLSGTIMAIPLALSAIFEITVSLVGKVLDIIRSGIDFIAAQFARFPTIDLGPAKDFSERTQVIFRPFTAIATGFGIVIGAIVRVWEWVKPIFVKIGQTLWNVFGTVGERLSDSFREMTILDVFRLINAALTGGLLISIIGFVRSLRDAMSPLKSFMEGVTGVLDGVRGSLIAYQQQIKAQVIKTISVAVMMLVAALVVLSLIPQQKLTVSLIALTIVFATLAIAMKVMTKTLNALQTAKTVGTVLAISAAILILSFALRSMVKTVDKFGAMDLEQLGAGFVVLIALLATLAGFIKIVGGAEKMIGISIGIVILSQGLKLMAGALRALGSLEIDEIGRGLLAMAGALLVIGLVAHVLPNNLPLTAIGMVIMASALLILAQAFKKFADFDNISLGIGLAAMAGALLLIYGAVKLIPVGQLLALSIGLTITSSALLGLSGVIAILGYMKLETVAQGVIAMGAALLILAAASRVMSVTGAAGMLVMAVALNTIIPAMLLLGVVPFGVIVTGLVALAAIFAVFGLAAFVLTPVAPIMLMIAGAMLMVATAVTALAIAMPILAVGLLAFALAAVPAAGGMYLLMKVMIDFIPLIAKRLAEGIMVFLETIAILFPSIINSVYEVLLGVISVISRLAPEVMFLVFQLLEDLFTLMYQYLPKLIELVLRTFIGILEAVRGNISEITELTMLIVVEFVRGFAAGTDQLVEAALELIAAFLIGLGMGAQAVTDAAVKMIIDFILAIAYTIEENAYEMGEAMRILGIALIRGFIRGIEGLIGAPKDAIVDMARGMWQGIKDFFGPGFRRMRDLARDIVDGLVRGIKDNIGRPVEAAKELGNSVVAGVKNILRIRSPSGVTMELGKNTSLGFLSGLRDGISGIRNMGRQTGTAAVEGMSEGEEAARRAAADAAMDNAESVGEEIGESLVGGTVKGIEKTAPKVTQATTKMVEDQAKIKADAEKAMFDAERSRIQHARRLQQMTTEEEIIEYVKLVRKFEEGTEARKMADKALFDSIVDNRNRGNISLMDEWRLWHNLSFQYVEGSEERRRAEVELHETRQRIYAEQTRLTEEMIKAEERYSKAVEDRTNAIVRTFGLFAEVRERDEVSGETLSSNLRDQVDALQNWSDNLTKLSRKGIDEGLLEELRKMGPSATAELEALNAMTARELTTYQNLWKEKNELARTIAVNELQGLREDISNEIADLQKEYDSLVLTDFRNFSKSGMDAAMAVAGGFKQTFPKVVEAAEELNETIVETIESGEPEFRQAGQEVTEAVIKGVNDKQPDAIATTRTNTAAVVREIASFVSQFRETGQNLISGLITGMRNRQEEAVIVAQDIAARVHLAAATELQTHSDSRVFIKMGEYCATGLANGMKNLSYLAENESKQMGKGVIDSIKQSVEKILDIIDRDFDMSPTIRPVLDMEDVEKGLVSITELLVKEPFAITGAVELAEDISKITKRQTTRDIQEFEDDTTGEKHISFTQNNYSPKALSRVEIYRQTKNQFSQLTGLVGEI